MRYPVQRRYAADSDDRGGTVASTQRVVMGEAVTWTVLADDCRVVGPVEQYLEYLRSRDCSPNTVRSYARALALWWTFLERRAQAWDAIGVTELGTFVGQLRRGGGPAPSDRGRPGPVRPSSAAPRR